MAPDTTYPQPDGHDKQPAEREILAQALSRVDLDDAVDQHMGAHSEWVRRRNDSDRDGSVRGGRAVLTDIDQRQGTRFDR